MKLSEMRQTLEERGIQLTKSLGQNFLHDAHQLNRIADLADLEPSDKVLEIGPGLGPLTSVLLSRADRVMAIEIDNRLTDFLQERFQGSKALHLVHSDALNFLRDQTHDWTGWKVVSNLPYSVASPILVELALSSLPPSRIVATLQSDVVNRLRSGPGAKDYGILTLLVTQRYQIGPSFKIPASCFFPRPAVDSGCLSMVLRNPILVPQDELKKFQIVVKLAFSQRRKMMSKLLKNRWSEGSIAAAMEACQAAPQARAEELSLEQFVKLSTFLIP